MKFKMSVASMEFTVDRKGAVGSLDGSTAIFGGKNNRFRYELRRVWDGRKPLLVVCMLNPSTADHQKDDPTILALIHFARLWGYGGLLVVNLCAFRASSPTVMMAAADCIGTENEDHIERALAYAQANGRQALAAWGNDGQFMTLEPHVRNRASVLGVDLICLGTTNSGAPKHPMARGRHRIPRDQKPLLWRTA